MYRFFVGVTLLVAILVGLIMVKSRLSPPGTPKGAVPVAVTFYPLQFLVTEIGGNNVQVYTVVPAGVEPHEYEPTVEDLRQVADANVLFVLGGGFEPWAKKLDQTKTVALGDTLIKNDDPHVWLDPIYMMNMAQTVYQTLSAQDPARTQQYRANLQHLTQQLTDLDTQLRQRLRICKRREVVTTHKAFGYLTERYALRQIEIAGLSPEQEPSPTRLAEVAKVIKQTQASTIFFETLASPKYAQTLARETGVSTVELNPLEGLQSEQLAKGEDYFSVMRANLAQLQTALECE